ncbi:MAG: hypothetical protein P8Q14_12120 [Vicingaceae bacterium]|nr:hypothetical protein [Vicingaceae bacterium]
MKKINTLPLLIVAVLLSTIAFGQKHPQKGKRPTKEKIKAMKISYITSQLDLTSAEAQQFWPIYNEFETKMEEFHKARRADRKKHKTEAELSDKELEKLVDNHLTMEQQELDTKKAYHTKFKKLLPIQKVAKLYKAEHSFKKDLLRKMRVKKGGPNELNIPPPPPPGH